MINKTQKYERVILLFLAIAVIFYITHIRVSGISRSREKKAYGIINHVLTLKIKGDISYKQFCSNDGFQGVEKNWPSKTNSFFVVFDDQTFGSYESKVFFDTGDVFYIVTTRVGDGKDKLGFFEKLKWPERRSGSNYWNVFWEKD